MYKKLVVLGMLVSLPASARDGWDLEGEFLSRTWRSPSLKWAQQLGPAGVSASWIAENVVPPPREMWCVDPANWDEYCDAWDFAMEQWLHHYLDVPYSEELPQNLPEFPKECPSRCSTW